jgi:hypothetical protein
MDQLGKFPGLSKSYCLKARFGGLDDKTRRGTRRVADPAVLRAQENEVALCLGRSAAAHHRYFVPGDPGKTRCKLIGVPDGCRKQNELRAAAIVTADPAEPPEDLADMAAENPAVGVHFVNNYIPESFPELLPFVVESQQGVMEHVRVCKKNVGMVLPDFGPLVRGGVPVVDTRCKRTTRFPALERVKELLQGVQLVVRKRLDGKKIDRAPAGVLDQGLGNGQIVYQRLSARGRRGDNGMPPRAYVLEGHGLVTVKRGYPEFEQRIFHGPGERGGKLLENRRLRWQFGMMGDFKIP